jgi:hypothetical protein
VRVGENVDALRLKRAAIPHGFRRRPLNQALVGDIGVGPLIDANEPRSRRARHRKRVKRSIGQHVNSKWQSGFAPDAIRGDRHMRRSFGTHVFRLRKGNVAVVLHDEAVEAGVGISSRVRERPRINRLDPAARLVGGRRQREKMDDSDQHAVRPAKYGCQRALPRSRNGVFVFRHC